MYPSFIKVAETMGSSFVDDEIVYKDSVGKCTPNIIKISKKF